MYSPDEPDSVRVAYLHQIGLKHDRSRIPELLVAMQPYPPPPENLSPVARERWLYSKPHPYFYYEPMFTLARLNAVEGLAEIDRFLAGRETEDYRFSSGGAKQQLDNFAPPTRARLAAELDAADVQDAVQRADLMLTRFMGNLQLSAEDLSRAAYRDRYEQTIMHPPTLLELFALQALADMIFFGRDLALLDRAQAAGIDFSEDFASALKITLTPLTRQARIVYLIAALLKTRVLGPDQYCLVQLAVDEGLEARQAAVQVLMEMPEIDRRDRNGTDIRPSASFPLLLMLWVIHGVGGTGPLPVLEPFLQDPAIRDLAKQVCFGSGEPHTYRVAY